MGFGVTYQPHLLELQIANQKLEIENLNAIVVAWIGCSPAGGRVSRGEYIKPVHKGE